MEKMKFEFFDFFSAVVPGLPLYLVFGFVINQKPFSFEGVLFYLHQMSLSEASVIILICYCIGFCIHYPAYELFQPIVIKFWPKRAKGFPISFGKREKILAQIRHQSPENFKVINKFFALRLMAYSMFFSLVISALVILVFSILTWSISKDQIIIVVLFLLFGYLFLRRAVDFHARTHDIITESSEINQKE